MNKLLQLQGANITNQEPRNSSSVFTQHYDYYRITGCIRTLTISLVAADIERDIERLHIWMNTPHVAEYWQQTWPINKIRRYLAAQISSYHDVYIVYVNNIAVGYTEIYPTNKDPLCHYYFSNKNDYGWHLLVGEPKLIGCGLNIAIGHCIVSFIFSSTNANTVLCEPDHNNKRMINFVKKLAHKNGDIVQMKHKKAQLMYCQKKLFNALNKPSLNIKPGIVEQLELLNKP